MGNDAPLIADMRVPDTTPLRGLVPIEIQLTDTASDPASVAMEYCSGCTNINPENWSWLPGRIAMGSQVSLQTAPPPQGVAHVLVWDSADSDAGVGVVAVTGVKIRLRACDNPEAIADSVASVGISSGSKPDAQQAGNYGYCGDWTTIQDLSIDNTAP